MKGEIETDTLVEEGSELGFVVKVITEYREGLSLYDAHHYLRTCVRQLAPLAFIKSYTLNKSWGRPPQEGDEVWIRFQVVVDISVRSAIEGGDLAKLMQ